MHSVIRRAAVAAGAVLMVMGTGMGVAATSTKPITATLTAVSMKADAADLLTGTGGPHLYWTNANGTILQADPDGSSPQTLVTGQFSPAGVAVDSSHIYWVAGSGTVGGGTIMKANLDGTGVTTLVTGQTNPVGLAVDSSHIYWADGAAGQTPGIIMEASLDGTGVTTLVANPVAGSLFDPLGVAVDSSHIYWADGVSGTIMEASLAGTGVTTLVANPVAGSSPGPFGMAVDGSHIYWTDRSSGTIMAASLDGTGVTTLVTGQVRPFGVAVDSSHIYWADGARGTITEANLNGTGVTTLITGQPDPGWVVVGPQNVPSGSLLVNPPSGAPGTQVTISGGGFHPGEPVHWFIGTTTPLVTGTADTSTAGGFSVTVTIPFGAPPSPYLVSAVGTSTGVTEVARLTVTGVPPRTASLQVNPPSGAPGTQVTISGSGFQPGEAVHWFIGTTTPLVTGTAGTNTAGGFSATVTIPSGAPPFPYLVSAVGASSGVIEVTSFTVTAVPPPTASLVVTPSSAAPGTQVTISGSGFQPVEAVNWFIGTTTPLVTGTAYTNMAGAFRATATIPFGAPPFPYLVSAVGTRSGAIEVTSLTVTGSPSLTLTGLSASTSPGVAEIPVASDSGFNVGDSVVIGLAGTNAEVRTIVGFGSLKLNKPLLFAHSAGEPVVLLPNPVADTTPPTTVASLGVPPNAAGWINQSPVGVNLLAQDEPGGSGVADTYYALDDNSCAPPATGSAIPSSCQSGNSLTVSGDGQHTLYFFSLDAAGNFEAQQHVAINIDTAAPTVTCSATPATLWPPDGKLVTVTVTVTVADAGSGPAGFTLLGVTTNEGDIASEMAGFVAGTPSTQGQLRAERDGTGSGRVYTLTYQGSDQAGNTASCSTTVRVPHDQGQ